MFQHVLYGEPPISHACLLGGRLKELLVPSQTQTLSWPWGDVVDSTIWGAGK